MKNCDECNPISFKYQNIPKITFEGVLQTDFENAFKALHVCTKSGLPEKNFPYPFVAPGGAYGDCWWQLDSSLALSGYKWYDTDFVKNALRNFIYAQRDDGRIPLYGYDKVQDYEPVSSLPKLFVIAYEIISHTGDILLASEIYHTLKRYLDWWFAARLDSATGLLSAVFEETFVPYLGSSGEYAPVDTNIEVAVGCKIVSLFARLLRYPEDEKKYKIISNQFKNAINKYLWNDNKGVYVSYLLKDRRHDNFLQSTTFQGLRLHTAPQAKVKKLVSLLKSSDFNWDTYPVTTASKSDPRFTATKGKYQYNASWSGNVWTLRNMDIIQALNDYKFYDLSSELSLKSVQEFNNKYWEFINAEDGSVNGENNYAWTASQYIQLIIEEIFGITVNAIDKTITIAPKLAGELKGKIIRLENIILFDGSRFSVEIDYRKLLNVNWAVSEAGNFNIIIDKSKTCTCPPL